MRHEIGGNINDDILRNFYLNARISLNIFGLLPYHWLGALSLFYLLKVCLVKLDSTLEKDLPCRAFYTTEKSYKNRYIFFSHGLFGYTANSVTGYKT